MDKRINPDNAFVFSKYFWKLLYYSNECIQCINALNSMQENGCVSAIILHGPDGYLWLTGGHSLIKWLRERLRSFSDIMCKIDYFIYFQKENNCIIQIAY